MIFDSLQIVIVIFALIGTGVLASWRKWVSKDVSKAFPRIIVNLTIPGTAIYSLYSNFSRQQLLDAWLPLLIIFTVVPLAYGLGILFSWVFKIPRTRRGVFAVSFSFSNSMFIGFPVAQALFGDAGMPYAVFYYLANTTCFWLLGNFAIRRDADTINGLVNRMPLREIFKKLVSPAIITILIMFIVIFTELKLPDFILTTARYLGNMTTPLSLIFMGCMIYDMGFSGMKWDRAVIPVLFGRFILIPALCFGACMLFLVLIKPSTDATQFIMMRNVFAIQISLPAMIQTSISAELYGADSQYATKNVFYTTLFSLLTIPAYMVLLQTI